MTDFEESCNKLVRCGKTVLIRFDWRSVPRSFQANTDAISSRIGRGIERLSIDVRVISCITVNLSNIEPSIKELVTHIEI